MAPLNGPLASPPVWRATQLALNSLQTSDVGPKRLNTINLAKMPTSEIGYRSVVQDNGRSQMIKASIGPTHKLVQTYYRTLEDYSAQRVHHETAVRSAFQNLLADSARTNGWMLIPELSTSGTGRVVPDGTLRDANGLPRLARLWAV